MRVAKAHQRATVREIFMREWLPRCNIIALGSCGRGWLMAKIATSEQARAMAETRWRRYRGEGDAGLIRAR